jgi:NADPH2:quinone reductase
MQAIRVTQTGGPEVLSPGEVDLPEPGPGHVRLRVEVAGVNYIDTHHRSGRYPLDLPFTPGTEAAGIVDALGEGVTELREGDRVAQASALGCYAEFAVVPADRLVAVPDDVPLETAAAVMLQGMTAHYLACDAYSLGHGDVALVHAGAGGVGHLLIQVAKLRGARVLTTVSTAEKERLARESGADEVIRYTEQDFAEQTRRLTAGAGAHVVYDGVGRTTFVGSLDSLRRRGCLVLYGQASGAVDPLSPQELARRGSLYLTRPVLADYIADRSQLLARASDLFGWIGEGRLHLRIDRTWPLAEAERAHRYLEGREAKGKVLLLP